VLTISEDSSRYGD